MVKKAQQQATQNFNRQYQAPRPDGRVRVDYVPPREKDAKGNSAGEFVEYEEVK